MSAIEAFDFNESVRALPLSAVDALTRTLSHIERGSDPSGAVKVGGMGLCFMVDVAQGTPLVTKILKEGDVCFEASVVAKLAGGREPPLAVPSLIEYDPIFPDHFILSKLPGVTLSNEIVRAFSPAEKRLLGSKIGAFVAWLSTAISPQEYRGIPHGSERGIVRDRTDWMRRSARKARAGAIPHSTLAQLLIEVEEEYDARRDSIVVPIVGHDDLRVCNLAFAQHDDLWQPTGVFDFGITKLSSPERELRHMLPLGNEVAEAAISSYTAITGQTLSRPLLRFWAIGQAASACAGLAEGADPHEFEESVNDLAFLLPDRDWSGLHGLMRR